MADRSLRFARSLSWSALGQTAGWAASFLATPILVRRFGLDGYGLYLLLSLVPSYLLLLTFSAGGSTVLKAAELCARGQGRALRELIGVSAALHVLGVAAGAAAVAAAAPWLARSVLAVPSGHQETAVLVLRLAAAGALFVSAAQLGTSLLQGFQRFDLHNLVLGAQAVLLPVLVVALAGDVGEGAAWYVAAQAAAAALAVALALSVWRRLGLPEGGPPLQRRALAKTTAGLWLSQWAWIAANQLDRLVVGSSIGLAELTLYAVPIGLLQRLQAIPATIVSIVSPMISGLTDVEKEEGLPRMYLKCVRAVLWASLPALVVLVAVMPQFLTLWLGPEFGMRSVWPARWFVVGQAASILALPAMSAAYGRGHPFYPTATAWAQAAITVAAWAVLAPRLGILGVAVGFAAGQALPVPFLLSRVHANIVKIGWRRYASESLWAPGLSAVVLLAAVFPLHHLAGTWARLGALCAGGAALYYATTWRLMSDEDRELARKILRPSRG